LTLTKGGRGKPVTEYPYFKPLNTIKMEAFGKFMTAIILMILQLVIKGFVILKLWGWIVVPLFGAPILTYIQAVALVFVLQYLQLKFDSKAEPDKFWENVLANFIFVIIAALQALFFGYIISLFL
jgi:hypothetical protein